MAPPAAKVTVGTDDSIEAFEENGAIGATSVGVLGALVESDLPGSSTLTGLETGLPGSSTPTGLETGLPGSSTPIGLETGLPGSSTLTGLETGLAGISMLSAGGLGRSSLP
jgi:hypothetical protein